MEKNFEQKVRKNFSQNWEHFSKGFRQWVVDSVAVALQGRWLGAKMNFSMKNS
jgi:hypothetical protein